MTEPTAPPSPAPATAPPPPRRIFTATCIIGVPGSGKTTLFDGFAVYLWETFRKVLLLYSWDGGAIPTQIQKRMQQGLIRFWRARTRSAVGLGIETVYLASKGYWPKTIDPLTGETAPAVQLVAPVTTSYALRCPKGHPMQTVAHASLIVPTFCSECKTLIGPDQFQVAESAVRTRGFEQVGGVGFDGLSSMANVVLEHMDIARGAGLIGGEKPAFGGVVESGGIKMGGNNRADIGFGQSRAQQFVNNALSIPYLVEGPVFTALSMETTDEGGLSVLGLKLPGRAATDEASAWFGNVYEMGRHQDDRGKSHFALFLRPFTDAQGRRHLLKTSASPTGLPAVLIDPPEDEHKPGLVANLGDVFRALDADLRNALAQQDVADAPGIASAPSSYGESGATAAAGASEAAAPATPGVMPTASTVPPSGIAPLAIPAPTTATPAPSATPVATPRGRKRATPTVPGLPRDSTPAAVPVPPPAPPAASAPAAVSGPSEAPPTQTAAATPAAPSMPVMGTTPPPPPGMRPPQRAPGS